MGIARRRPAGPMDHAVLPAARPCQNEPAGGDRRAGVAFGTLSDFVLAAYGAAWRAGGRKSRAKDNPRGAARPRSHRRDRPRLVGGPPDRRIEAGPPPARRGQSPRHARLCGRTVEHDPEKWEPVFRKKIMLKQEDLRS